MFSFFSARRPCSLNTISENIGLYIDFLEEIKFDLELVSEAKILLSEYDSVKDTSKSINALIPRNHDEKLNEEIIKDYTNEYTLIENMIRVEAKLVQSLLDSNNPEVTIESLRATRGSGHRYLWTPVGRYLMLLWLVMISMIAAALTFEYKLSIFESVHQIGDINPKEHGELFIFNYINPFVFGTLGACAYLMRITGKRLTDRTFNPARLPEHWNRLFLGTMSGGVIILFVQNAISVGPEGGGVTLSAAAIGFLAGYSIDFLYQIIDRIINAVIPKIDANLVKDHESKKKLDAKIMEYKRKMKEAEDSGDDKLSQFYKKIIDDLS